MRMSLMLLFVVFVAGVSSAVAQEPTLSEKQKSQLIQRFPKSDANKDGKLDDAIASYQRGAELKAHCESKLRDAQEKVEKISLAPGGDIKAEAFDVG